MYFQFRLIEKVDEMDPFAAPQRHILPYFMDLGSTNGSTINDDSVESARYYQLLAQDALKIGHSSREYIVIAEDLP